MSRTEVGHELGAIVFGAIVSTSVGAVFLQALGAIALGLLGALGGYLFTKVIKPKLDKTFTKKTPEA